MSIIIIIIASTRTRSILENKPSSYPSTTHVGLLFRLFRCLKWLASKRSSDLNQIKEYGNLEQKLVSNNNETLLSLKYLFFDLRCINFGGHSEENGLVNYGLGAKEIKRPVYKCRARFDPGAEDVSVKQVGNICQSLT